MWLNKAIEWIAFNIFLVISFVALLFYSGYFIHYQLKLFPGFCKMRNSELFKWIPLCLSYILILKLISHFRHISFNFYTIGDCIWISLLFWGFFGRHIEEQQKD